MKYCGSQDNLWMISVDIGRFQNGKPGGHRIQMMISPKLTHILISFDNVHSTTTSLEPDSTSPTAVAPYADGKAS